MLHVSRSDLFVLFFLRLFFSSCFFLVDQDEIRRLGKRFKKLDVDGSGSLSVQEFMSIPELQQNPLVQRVIDIFDTDGNGEIDFKGRNQLFSLRSTFILSRIYRWNIAIQCQRRQRI